MKLESIVSHITETLSQSAPTKSQYAPVDYKDSFCVIAEHTQHLSENEKKRIVHEFSDTGPLETLLVDSEVTEIIINGPENIWFEKEGRFFKHTDMFLSLVTYSNFIHLLAEQAGIQTNHRTPFGNGEWRSFRVHLASPPITIYHTLTLRRLKPYSLSLDSLKNKNWCSEQQLVNLKSLVNSKKNILVVGSTGSGKTTLLNSLILEAQEDRCVYIEDTAELVLNNSLSTRLLTRFDAHGGLPSVDQTDLVKQSLRMRPDRLILGEIRGGEAKDLLLALSTGHHGSMASIHAGSPQEALMRLEMLVLMGAPEWNLMTIRRLIQLTIDAIIVTKKGNGFWQMQDIYKIASLEEFGFIVESVGDL
ncbi:MAG: CpaF family protein [Bdellovibrionaceae bacterium]|nr:CpaF family protein [Pseudobdellovibrionaceae bacterium]